jgi:pimeloyl-ACP methyl ester carboxylesterase
MNMFSKIRYTAMIPVITLLMVCLSDICPAVYGQDKSLAGKWTGILEAGMKLRLVFNISQKDDGTYAATLDSPDQGASGIPVASAILKERQFDLQAPAIGGVYEGTVSDDGQSIDGNWSQGGRTFPVRLELKTGTEEESKPEMPATVTDVRPEDMPALLGKWLGNLTIPGPAISLRLVLNIMVTEDNILVPTIDSPDQGAKDIPVSNLELRDNHIRVEVRTIGAVFEGDFALDGMAIDGNWSQGGRALPLLLKRVDNAPEPKRPQEPKEPYPYRSEEVEYPNEESGNTLAGTLTLPDGDGPFPAVVLISGSGVQDRNETIFGHKPFLLLADHLTRRGIAVLRFDDRGSGKSTGDFSTATTPDLATDVRAGINYLKTRKEVDPRKMGLIGHSEGGLIAPMLAVQTDDVAFIVLLAGPGIRGAELLRLQQGLLAKANGVSEDATRAAQNLNARLFQTLQNEPDNAAARTKMRALADEFRSELDPEVRQELKKMEADQLTEAVLEQATSPWFRYFIAFEPAEWLEQVRCPVLAMNGERDLQVPPAPNLQGISAALEKGGNKNFTTRELPGLNHLFQTAETGAISEYGQIEETISPVALNMISEWITSVAR